MTLCVGITDESGRCRLGADSFAFVEPDEIAWELAEPKAWTAGPILWADAGPVRPSQILRSSFVVPELPEGSRVETIRDWLTGPVIEEVFRHLDHEYTTKKQRESHALIVGFRGVLGIVYPETWEILFPKGPVAIGHPGAVQAALGYLRGTEGEGRPHRERLKKALEVGAAGCAYVRDPFVFVDED